jgi:hypothetical protein
MLIEKKIKQGRLRASRAKNITRLAWLGEIYVALRSHHVGLRRVGHRPKSRRFVKPKTCITAQHAIVNV